MSPAQIQRYITIGSGLVGLGFQVAGQMATIIRLFEPHVELSEADANAIEAGIVADAERRAAERTEMGKATAE